MANKFKMEMKRIGRYIWELFKSSILPTVMYCCASSILMMLVMRGEEVVWGGSQIAWTVVCVVGGAAYQALAAWANGGTQYEMLVSGNVKRSTCDAYGNEYRMAAHKMAKEYRPWKGFAIGGFVALFPVLFGVVLGCNQAEVHSDTMRRGLGIMTVVSFFLSGWTTIPFYCMNAAGVSASYFLSLLLAIIPVVVGGVMYIGGAYSRRNKNLRMQMLADKAAEADEARRANKKINYGGLPGTKPKKRK